VGTPQSNSREASVHAYGAAGRQPNGALYSIAVTLPDGEAVEEVFELEAPSPTQAPRPRRRAAEATPMTTAVPATVLPAIPSLGTSPGVQNTERVVAACAH
jgi:hypothetical protein